MPSNERDDYDRNESDDRRRDDRDHDDHRRSRRGDDDYDDRPQRRRRRDEDYDRPRYKKSGSGVVVIILCVVGVVFVAGGIFAYFAVQKVREAAARVRSQTNVKQMAFAIHNMESANGRYPAAAICDKQGTPLLSWRVAILPYVEHAALYNKFRLDEPWDSPTNKALISMMPKIYEPISNPDAAGEYKTYYRMIVPKGEIGTEFTHQDLVAGGKSTGDLIMIVEAGDPVIWTKPEELEYTQGDALPSLGGLFPKSDVFSVAFYDGSVRVIKRDEIESLKAMIRPKIVRLKK